MARKVRVTLETPRTLWCGHGNAAKSGDRTRCYSSSSSSSANGAESNKRVGVSGTATGSGSDGGGGKRTAYKFSWHDTKRVSSNVAPYPASTLDDAVASVASGACSAAAAAAAPAAVPVALSAPVTSVASVTRRSETAPTSRVPPVRAVSIKWQLPVAELLSPKFFWPEGLKELHFGALFDDALEGVVFPETLEGLTFGYRFNKSLGAGCVRWPPRLKRLRFGAKWNRSLVGAGIGWPASLEVLHFGTGFDKPLQGEGRIGLPPGLREIHLGGVFNQPLSGVEWPSKLQKLTFSEYFNKSLDFDDGGVGVSFPAGLREISFGSRFDQEVSRVAWPKSLEALTFGDGFNRAFVSPGIGSSPVFVGWASGATSDGGGGSSSVRGLNVTAAVASSSCFSPFYSVVLPAGLKVLVLGDGYNHSMNGAELPDGLEKLVLGKSFSFMRSVRWPSGLKRLHLSCKWGAHVGGGGGAGGGEGDRPYSSRRLILPKRLEYLDVGDQFNSPLDSIALPASLKILNLGSQFDHPIAHHVKRKPDVPPESNNIQDNNQEQRGHRGDQGPNQGHGGQQEKSSLDHEGALPALLPDGLEELRLGAAFNHEIENTRLPKRLKRLFFSADSKFDQPVAGVEWPSSLEELRFGNCFDQPMVQNGSGGVWGNGHVENFSGSVEGPFGGGGTSCTMTLFPATLRELHFGWAFSYSLQGLELPRSLRRLSFFQRYPMSHVRGLEWPDSLQSISVGSFRFGSRGDLFKWTSQPPF